MKLVLLFLWACSSNETPCHWKFVNGKRECMSLEEVCDNYPGSCEK